MGTIVKNWITNKLGLEIAQDSSPATFRYEVANGILIAEILRKYGLLSDDEFISLRHDNTQKSRTENMRHVHRWLENTGMNLNESLMQDVAEEKSGCAIKFLYELFLWLENGPRKPTVGDKAKKYLSNPRRISVKTLAEVKEEQRKSREARMSALSSTWMHSLQTQEEESEPLDNEVEVLVPETKFKTMKKQRNWFTTLDTLKNFQPGRLDPFIELSEAAQAEAIYFAEKAVDIFKDQEELKNEIRAIQRRKLAAFASVQNEDEEIRRTLTKCEVADRSSQAKEEQKAYAEQEIRKFDSKLEQKRKKGLDIQNSSSGAIYQNGRGCKEHFQASLQKLKHRRQKEVNAGIERCKWRRTAMSKIIHEIPSSMFTVMQDEVLKLACTSLPSSEQRLADFLHFGHQEKSLFKQHAYFDAMQRQNARNLDLKKASRIEEEQKKLKRKVLEYKYEDHDEGKLHGCAIADSHLFNEFVEGKEEYPQIELRYEQKFVLNTDHGFEDEEEGEGEERETDEDE